MPDNGLNGLTLHRLPPPDALAVPLAADAIVQVRLGDVVGSGDVLAEGTSGADILAPLGGEVVAFARRPLASVTHHGGSALCAVLANLSAAPPRAVRTTWADSIPLLLKRAGVVGLGGGAFPAWRKWRQGLRWLVVNGLETEPTARHDAALLAAAFSESPEQLIARVMQVARAFGAAPLLVLPEEAGAAAGAEFPAHPCIRRLPRRYALGNERLLLQEVCGLHIPPDGVVADYGAVCFNIGTVFAMAAALTHGAPLTERVITVHGGQGEQGGAMLLTVPFGASVGDVRRHLGGDGAAAAVAAAMVGGGDEQRQVGDDAVLTAATTVIRFGAGAEAGAEATGGAAMPCIRCGACEPVCPAALSPQRLYHLSRDSHLAEMAAERLTHCLECRRCDEVCPSRIPLTATFIEGKRELAAVQAEAREVTRRRDRFDRHTERLTKPTPRIASADLSRHVQEAVEKAKKRV